MTMTVVKGPLAKAIAQQSAEWLEGNFPLIYEALGKELETGHNIDDIRRILRRIFGNELRDAFVLRVLQAAEFMFSEQVNVTR